MNHIKWLCLVELNHQQYHPSTTTITFHTWRNSVSQAGLQLSGSEDPWPSSSMFETQPCHLGSSQPVAYCAWCCSLGSQSFSSKKRQVSKNSWQKDPEGHSEHFKIFHFIRLCILITKYHHISSCVEPSILNKLVPPGCGIVFDG